MRFFDVLDWLIGWICWLIYKGPAEAVWAEKSPTLSEELAEGQINRLEMFFFRIWGEVLMSQLFWQKERDVARNNKIE